MSLLQKIFINQDLNYTLANKIIGIVKGPITLLFIFKFLSSNEQGIWFTFISLGALSVFAELGFTAIISQFISHEYAHLKISHGYIIGKRITLDKLFSLIHYAIKLYIFIIPLGVILLFFAGYFIFSNNQFHVLLMWFFYSLIGGLQLFLSLLNSITQGFDKIALVQKNILLGGLIAPFIMWSGLFFNFGIMSLVVGSGIAAIVMIVFIFHVNKKVWLQFLRHKLIYKYSWFHEIIPLQIKYGASFISGYFISYFYTPMIYKFESPEVAGQFGLTMSMLIMILTICMSWIEIKIPKMNILVAHKNQIQLKETFKNEARISLILFTIGMALFYLFILIINKYSFYNERFLSTYNIFLLIIVFIPNIFMDFLGKYSRLHKAEPLYIMSLTTGLLYFIAINFLRLESFHLVHLLYIILCINWFIALPFSYYVVKKFNAEYYKV